MADGHFITKTCEPNTVNRHIESFFCAKFLSMITTLCMLGFQRFHMLSIMGKGTSCHPFSSVD